MIKHDRAVAGRRAAPRRWLAPVCRFSLLSGLRRFAHGARHGSGRAGRVRGRVARAAADPARFQSAAAAAGGDAAEGGNRGRAGPPGHRHRRTWRAGQAGDLRASRIIGGLSSAPGSQLDPNQQVQDNSMASRLLGSGDSAAADEQPRNHAAQGGLLTGRRTRRDFRILPRCSSRVVFRPVASRLAGLICFSRLRSGQSDAGNAGRGAEIRRRELHPRQRHADCRAAEPSGPGGDADRLVPGRRRRRPARKIRHRPFSRTSDVQGHENDRAGRVLEA